MPDIFVPADTSDMTPYFREVAGRNILYRFTLDYTDRHRAQLNGIRTLEEPGPLLRLAAGPARRIRPLCGPARRGTETGRNRTLERGHAGPDQSLRRPQHAAGGQCFLPQHPKHRQRGKTGARSAVGSPAGQRAPCPGYGRADRAVALAQRHEAGAQWLRPFFPLRAPARIARNNAMSHTYVTPDILYFIASILDGTIDSPGRPDKRTPFPTGTMPCR